MKALVKYAPGKGNMEIRDVPVPGIEADEVLIKVKYAGICGSDLKIMSDEHPYYPPVITGHEFSGEIVEAGGAVKGWDVGDRVVSELHTMKCGMCSLCKSGEWYVCKSKRAPGWGIDGAFAEYVKMPAWLLHRIPENVSFKEAAVTEPVAVAVNAVLESTRVEPGDFVAVLGCGPLGLIAAQLAKAVGASASLITGTEKDEGARLPAARKLGIDYVVNVQRQDPVALVKELTGGIGADLVVDFAGAQPALLQGFEMVRIHGRFCAVGVPPTDMVEVPWKALIYKGVNVVFNFSSKYTSWKRALQMMETGRLDVKPLITHVLPLDAWQEGFDLAKRGDAIKVLLAPESL